MPSDVITKAIEKGRFELHAGQTLVACFYFQGHQVGKYWRVTVGGALRTFSNWKNFEGLDPATDLSATQARVPEPLFFRWDAGGQARQVVAEFVLSPGDIPRHVESWAYLDPGRLPATYCFRGEYDEAQEFSLATFTVA